MLRYAAATDVGLVRKNNEDSYYIGCPLGGLQENLFIVADGMGGHKGGEYASRFVVQKIPELLKRRTVRGNLPMALQEAVERTNKALYQISQDEEALNGMGSTLVLAYFDKEVWRIINVGDSRAYTYYQDQLEQITVDHSLVEELVRSGRLERSDPLYQAHRNVIMRAMGVDPYVEEDLFSVPVRSGMRLLLCSDGLHGLVDDETIARILGEEPEPEPAVERLMALAKEAGGKDNVTAILIDWTEENE